MALDLGKQVGPMPLGAWVIVVGGGLGIALWSRNSSANPAREYVADDTGTPDGVGDGSVGGWLDTSPPDIVPASNGDSSIPDTITDNDQWAAAAIKWLISQGYDSNDSYSAITKAFLGEPLSVHEYALWGAAVRGLGPPPFPPLVLPPSPLPTVSAPVRQPVAGSGVWATVQRSIARTDPAIQQTVSGATAFNSTQWHNIAPAVSQQAQPQPGTFEYYTVKAAPLPGSTLKSISQIKYGRPDWWERIYNHNRAGVKRDDGTMGMIQNPNVLRAGWRLIIPR